MLKEVFTIYFEIQCMKKIVFRNIYCRGCVACGHVRGGDGGEVLLFFFLLVFLVVC